MTPTLGNSLSGNQTISDIISNLGKYLKPQQAFTDQLPYESFAQPQREVLNTFLKDFATPQFEQQTLNPFKSSYANNAAGSGAYNYGNSGNLYKQAYTQTTQPFYNDVEQYKNAYEDMIRNLYNNQLTQSANSPINNFNYNQ